jgi:hypothetical protein
MTRATVPTIAGTNPITLDSKPGLANAISRNRLETSAEPLSPIQKIHSIALINNNAKRPRVSSKVAVTIDAEILIMVSDLSRCHRVLCKNAVRVVANMPVKSL